MAGDASVGYSVAAFPMRIVLQGITETEEGDALMIGQQIIATVEMLNVPSGATPTFEWTVTGDGKFKSYKIVNGEQDPNDEENLIFSATYLGEDTIDFHSASVELTFAEPGSAEFSCEIDLGLAGLEPFTISRPLLVLAPFSPDIHTEGGYVHDTGVSLRASEVQITIPDTPTYLWRGVTTSLFGIVWTSQAMTPEPMWKSSGSDYDRGAVSFAILAEKRHWEWNTPSASGVEAPSNFSAPTPESRKIYVGFQYNTLTSDGILPIDPQFLEMEAERPGISTGDKIWVAFEEVFMAYFMYLPPAHGLPRYWVPLSRQGVTVDFTANKSGSTFAISGEEVYVGSTGPYPSHPVWTSMVGRDP